MSNFIEQNNILYVNQFGFRKFHNTIDALINTHDYIISKKRSKKKVVGIFLDLKKAFDSIDNSILIKKLQYYGIDGPYNDLLKSYLSTRKVYTYIDSTSQSDLKDINYGVPQGSVLGPLLFSLYINDIKILANNYDLSLFADDTCLFCTGDNYTELNAKCNQALIDCNNWLQCNRLTLNAQKTHFVDFSNNSNNSNIIELKLGQHVIEKKSYTKYLGLTLQNDLRWDKHIKNVINKLNSQIPFYYQLKEILPKNKILTAFKSLSLTQIIYGIELFIRNTKWTNQIQKVQNRLLKILLSKQMLTRSNYLHKECKILKIQDMMKLRCLLISHKVIHQKDKLNASHNHMLINHHNGRTLRNNLSFQINVDAYTNKNKVTERAMVLWNDLPHYLRNIESRNLFKSKLEEYYLHSYV